MKEINLNLKRKVLVSFSVCSLSLMTGCFMAGHGPPAQTFEYIIAAILQLLMWAVPIVILYLGIKAVRRIHRQLDQIIEGLGTLKDLLERSDRSDD